MREKMLTKAFFMVLLINVSVMAQDQTPCDSRVSMAEARVAAERVQVQTCRARVDLLEQELEQLKAQLGDRAGEKQKSTTTAVTASNDAAQREIADLKGKLAELDKAVLTRNEMIAILTRERDEALRKTKSANRRSLVALIAAVGLGIFGIAK